MFFQKKENAMENNEIDKSMISLEDEYKSDLALTSNSDSEEDIYNDESLIKNDYNKYENEEDIKEFGRNWKYFDSKKYSYIDAMERIYEVIGTRNHEELAQILEMRQSSTSSNLKKHIIPADWFLKIYEKFGINPEWIKLGGINKHIHYYLLKDNKKDIYDYLRQFPKKILIISALFKDLPTNLYVEVMNYIYADSIDELSTIEMVMRKSLPPSLAEKVVEELKKKSYS